MVIGDRVQLKIKDKWIKGTIICIYAVPKDWSLVDIELDNGDILRGISTQDIVEAQDDN